MPQRTAIRYSGSVQAVDRQVASYFEDYPTRLFDTCQTALTSDAGGDLVRNGETPRGALARLLRDCPECRCTATIGRNVSAY